MEGGGSICIPDLVLRRPGPKPRCFIFHRSFIVLFSIHVMSSVHKSIFFLEQSELRQYVPVLLFTKKVEETVQIYLKGEEIKMEFILASSI